MATKICKRCGEYNSSSSMICCSCGESLSGATEINQGESITYNTENNNNINEEEKTKECSYCDAIIKSTSTSCQACGEYITKVNNNIQNKDNLSDSRTLNQYPNVPSTFDIGKQIAISVSGTYYNNGTIFDDIPSGKITILLFDHGIKICSSFYREYLLLHYSQIESMCELSKEDLAEKSVVGRAIVGGILLGGLGAIIGGMSGIGSKKVMGYYLIINFWDKETRSLKSISIGCDSSPRRFISNFYDIKQF